MRNIDERLAEISRRSDIIFKVRKQRRKHMLMTCVPLALCLTLFSAFILPAMMPALDGVPKSSDELYVGETEAIADTLDDLFIGSIKVSGNGVSHSYTSVEDVQQIMGLINSIVAVPETDDEAGRDYITYESTTDKDEAYTEKGYTIIITHSSGISTEYYLLGNILTDQNTKKEFSLAEKVYFELKDALGIPLY